MLLAGLEACDYAPAEEIVPWVEQPERAVPGRPLYYASAIPFCGYLQPVVAECHAGRPTRLDGNARHPISTGDALDPFTQAAVLQLYDPDRSRTCLLNGNEDTSWARAQLALAAILTRLEERKGEGLRIVTGAISSPTLVRQLGALRRRFPASRWHVLEPSRPVAPDVAARLAFGRAVEVQWRLDQADVVVDLEADLLGPGPCQLVQAAGWSARRRTGQRTQNLNRLLVAESTPSPTGGKADRRLRIASGRIPYVVAGLANEVGLDVPAVELTDKERDFVASAAKASLVAVGAHQPPWAQALGIEINERIGARGKAMRLREPIIQQADPLDELARDLEAGAVDTLILIDVNPAFTAPDLPLARAANRIHFGQYVDETAAVASLHLPLAHALESWTDGRAIDCTASIVQPMVRPLFGGLELHTVLDVLTGGPARPAREIVRETWSEVDDATWRRSLESGFVAESSGRELDLAPHPFDRRLIEFPQASETEVLFRPDASIWDGRFANLGWLQELPKPLTKLTWDNVALVSPAFAARMGLVNGQMAALKRGNESVELPAWILPGQADGTVTLAFGHGRRRAGRVGTGTGFDVYPLRAAGDRWRATDVTLTPLAQRYRLASTQAEGSMAGLDLVKWESPAVAAAPPHPKVIPPDGPSLFEPSQQSVPQAWAMSIDLDVCIGCNACVIGCQAENNIATVGKDQVEIGREMHWIRVDRYFDGPDEDPDVHFQPLPCMHCEHAPCEVGCPVNAAVHTTDGLNAQIYNRCIGTRTCSSYCPYKVRRFNFYDYTSRDDEGRKPQRNPNVTVRSRGVMEKCTYCIQRISAARRDAFADGRLLSDGDVRTACQAACPTEAIVFGNQNDATSAIADAKRDPRDYVILEDINTRPRTSYRARIRAEEEKS